MTAEHRDSRVAPTSSTGPVDLDADAGARGGLYGLLASAFESPDRAMHEALTDGSFAETAERLLDRTALDVESPDVATNEGHDLLSARYNDLFELGYAEYEDRTDGTLSTAEPPVPLHESAYRTDVSWGDVNLDLARAYDYFGLEIDREDREHHDHLRLQLEFAGYLARREAAVDPSAGAARLDFLDRHLRILVESVRDRLLEESGPGVYADLARLLDEFTAADREDLVARLEGDA